ncbi:hypothetical protein ANTQUA_LOCUS5888 [Anthophora quadrimaculata]
MSSLLFDLYVGNIASNVPRNVIVSQFADDLAVYTKTANSARGVKSIEKAIRTLKIDLRHLGLEISPNKTVLIHFNNKKISPGNINIKIDDIVIKSKKLHCVRKFQSQQYITLLKSMQQIKIAPKKKKKKDRTTNKNYKIRRPIYRN